MKFQLDLVPQFSGRKIHHSEGISMIGSCFTGNIGIYLRDLFFNVQSNPTGILFDAKSVCRHLQRWAEYRLVKEEEVEILNELYFLWDFHGDFSGTNKEQVIKHTNEAIAEAHKNLLNSSYLIITLGSAFSYRLKDRGTYVANNHKAPASFFEKVLTSSHEIIGDFDAVISKLAEVNPDLQLIFTISPVRHIREGVIENNRSKARLIEAVHQLVEKYDNVFYFPSYELVIDVLRDHRFYDIDLVHPNYAATQFVFECFCECFMDEETQALLAELKKLNNALHHRPLHPGTQAHAQFVKNRNRQLEEMKRRLPWVDWEGVLKTIPSKK